MPFLLYFRQFRHCTFIVSVQIAKDETLINEEDSLSHVRKTLQRCRKENKNPPWKVFYPFLKAVYKRNNDFSYIFLNQYFYSNFRNAVEWLSLKKSDLSDLENFCHDYNPYNVVDFIEKHVSMDSIKDINNFGEYFDNILQKNAHSNLTVFQNDINKIRENIPHSFSFWANWFCAKDFVYKYLDSANLDELENAVNWYERAFSEGKYFMGKNSELFIHEAIVVSNYYDVKKNPIQARTRLQKNNLAGNDTKSPLDRITKEFYDFGLAFDFLLNDTNDANILYYQCFNNFWTHFTPESKMASEIKSKDLYQASGLENDKTLEIDSIFKSRETLLSITDGKINNILPTVHNVAYTPISSAIIQEYYDIAEQYMDIGRYPSLDLNIPNTNNCYPIHEIVTKYVRGQNREKAKDLTLKILDRTDKKVLFTRTNRQKLSALQTVIQSMDIDLNRAFLNKMFGKEKIPDDFLISADEVSPLYFALMSKYLFNNPLKYMNDKKSGNINYSNLFVPGLSETEKEKEDKKFDSFKQIFRNVIKNIENKIPKEEKEKKDKEISLKSNEIINLYIERTSNVDGFISYSNTDTFVKNQGCTALLYACEMDDVVVCKKLIEKGSDLHKSVGMVDAMRLPNGQFLSMENNFILRAIYFKSWNCLEMFLKEYKSVAAEYMHRKDCNMTYLVLFLISMIDEIKQNASMYNTNINLIQRFTPEFLEAGASLQEPTAWGSAEQILREINLS